MDPGKVKWIMLRKDVEEAGFLPSGEVTCRVRWKGNAPGGCGFRKVILEKLEVSRPALSLSLQDLQPRPRPSEPALPRLEFDNRNKRRKGIGEKQPIPHAPAGIAQAIIGIPNTLELLRRTVRRIFPHLAHVGGADLFFGGILIDA
jgi:hypothetical protein